LIVVILFFEFHKSLFETVLAPFVEQASSYISGQDEESKVYFTEHVFLEHLLDPWCPKKGPVRHFMELVCVGLSKNPYITVQMKMEHIHWFRDYFQQKKQVLEETGALPHIKDSEPTVIK
ncbi:hypothetical protein ANN_11595, partial [Periplaneta americana]